MRVISIDLEANQPSGTIIQLGYVVGDVRTGEIFVRKCITINPNETLGYCNNDTLHITDLTGITQEEVDAGVSLGEAYNEMCDDISKFKALRLIQWGSGDTAGLVRQLGIRRDDFVFSSPELDVKQLSSIRNMVLGKKMMRSLGYTVNELGLSFEGRQHNALVDAKATFDVFRFLVSHFKKGKGEESPKSLA